MPVVSVVERVPDMTSDSKMTDAKEPLPALSTAADGADTTAVPNASATATLPGPWSGTPRGLAIQGSKATGESSAAAPSVARKPAKTRKRPPVRDYGI